MEETKMSELEAKVKDKKFTAMDIAKMALGTYLVYDPIKKKILVESEEKKKLIRRTLVGAGLGVVYDQLEKFGAFDYIKNQTDKVKGKMNAYKASQ
jgi:hypothetical protein